MQRFIFSILVLGSTLGLTQGYADCPLCRRIESERAQHPQKDAGYYDEGEYKNQIQNTNTQQNNPPAPQNMRRPNNPQNAPRT